MSVFKPMPGVRVYSTETIDKDGSRWLHVTIDRPQNSEGPHATVIDSRLDVVGQHASETRPPIDWTDEPEVYHLALRIRPGAE